MFTGRNFLLFTFSGLLALGAAWLANNWLEAKNKPLEMAAQTTQVPVVTAALNIPEGQRVETKHLKVVYMPEEVAPKGAISSLEELEGMIAQQDALPGEILMKARFSEYFGGSTLAAMIEPNMRAVTVRVNDVIGVAGFLLPGNRVDIIAARQSGGKRVVSETVLSDIKVLAVDQTATTKENDPIIVRAVTLEVSPKEAELLVKARDEGTIQLSLRNPVDKSVVEKEKPKRRIVRRPVQEEPSVTIIRGTTAQQTKIKL